MMIWGPMNSDLVTVFGVNVLPLVDREMVQALVTHGRKSKSKRMKMNAQWVFKEIRRVKQAGQAPLLANALSQPTIPATQ